MGLRFDYGDRFEKLWSVHSIGNKKLAYDQWLKLKLSEAENDELCQYLSNRQKDDVLWVNGKVHHLRTVLSQRKWEENDYQRIKRDHWSLREPIVDQRPVWVQRGFKDEATYESARDAAAQRARADLRRDGLLH
jgi:hypothetical protein